MWMTPRRADPALEAAMQRLDAFVRETARWSLFWPK